MCYYDNYKFVCRDWKWGKFRQRCHLEHRTGETCGIKLISETIKLLEQCPFCKRIERKLRRRQKAINDIKRWHQEPRKFHHSIGKACQDIKQLEDDITRLQAEKASKYAAVGKTRHARHAFAANGKGATKTFTDQHISPSI